MATTAQQNRLRRRHQRYVGQNAAESPPVEQPDRGALERDGWRTLLDYRENHIRDGSGLLLQVEPCWIAEAEHCHDRFVVASVTASTVDTAWARLRIAAVAAQRRPFDGQGDV